MHYQLQMLLYSMNGSLERRSDFISIGKYSQLPTKEMFSLINSLTSDLDSMNIACGLLPSTIETNRYKVVILVLDESDDPICYSQLFEYKPH